MKDRGPLEPEASGSSDYLFLLVTRNSEQRGAGIPALLPLNRPTFGKALAATIRAAAKPIADDPFDAPPFGGRPAAFTTQNPRQNPLAKVIGKRSGHQMLAATPARILNHKTEKSGIPFDSIKP